LEYRTFSDFANNICFITPDVTQFIKLYEGYNNSFTANDLLVSTVWLYFQITGRRFAGRNWSLLTHW